MRLTDFKLFTLIPVAFFLFLFCWSCASGQDTYVSSGAHHCLYCPKGSYVQEDCKEDLTSPTCERCPQHHFSDEPNKEKHCKLCRSSCPKASMKTVDCSAETDRECECDKGHYKFPLDALDDHWKCRPHSPCGEGEGEIYSGNHTHNTKCQKCEESQFVNGSDPQHPVCQNCRHCPVFLKKCTKNSDAVCGDPQDTNRTPVSSPPPASTTAASTESGDVNTADSDTRALIGGILGGLVCVVVVVAVAIWLAWKGHVWEDEFSKKWKVLWIVSMLLVAGSVGAILYVIYKRRRICCERKTGGNDRDHSTYSAVNRNGEPPQGNSAV